METQIILWIVFLSVLLAQLLKYWADKNHALELDARATEDFRSFTVDSVDPCYSFSGTSAQIQKREVTGGVRGLFEKTADYGVTVYAMNEHGEQFLWKWFSKSPKPYFKHLNLPRQHT